MVTFDFPPVNWKKRGYFEFLDSRPDSTLSPGWAQWLAVLRQATTGDFSELPDLINLARTSNDLVLVQSCYYLLGDAGGSTVAALVRSEAMNTDDFDLMLECCDAIVTRGWLADVPILLELYTRNVTENEASIIKVFISDCVTQRPGELPDPSDHSVLPDFREAVMARYRQLAEELGTTEVPVFKAKRFGLRSMAGWLLSQVHRPHFRMSWRRKFEVTTGIECTSFYESARFQPLTAAAIIEQFIESPEAKNYTDGVRYFFGHRIPD